MLSRIAQVLALLGICLWTPAALAQGIVETAPRIDSQSPGGVSYGTGGFTYDLPVLSIGNGDFPEQLALTLQYRSDGARLPNTPWATNLAVRTSVSKYDPLGFESACPPYCNPGDFTYAYNIVAGQLSDSFSHTGPAGGLGPFVPIQLNGASLTWNGGINYTYTSSAGAVLNVTIPIGGTAYFAVSSWTEPDGTQITYDFSGTGSSGGSISTNRGLALFFEAPAGSGSSYTQKICALNLMVYYLPSVTTCPSGVPTVTVAGPSLNGSGGGILSSVTDTTGGTTSFTYGTSGGTDGHLKCIKKPGQATCWVTNVYDTCDGQASGIYADPNANGSRDRVTSQTFATGEVLSYSYVSVDTYPLTGLCRGNSKATLTQGSSMTQVSVSGNWRGALSRLPYSIIDPLGRTSTMSYTGNTLADVEPDLTRPLSFTRPEGDIVQYKYDGGSNTRGNVTETRVKAKPGSGLADIVTSAVYPATCPPPDIKICNKPTKVFDANGNVTTYSYDAAHGGVLTKTGPTVGGVAPATRYYYAQRYAWIKNAGGGFSHAASPVWVMTEERSCRTSALNTTTGACAAGTTDLVITDYDYGPDTGLVGNNLWLRGMTVTADVGGVSTTLRTCYGYDAQGNRISETKPRAGLTVCP